MRINRYVAQAGVCSRREADDLIAKGYVKVNGKVVTELGVKINPRKDKVEYKGKILKPQNFIYILLNKPKNMITTNSDPQGRKTVIDAVADATTERVFPVGRLDRNTTGLILLTNDGELAKKLTHPSHRVRKVYHVGLNKPVLEEDMQRLLDGISLEDGEAKVDKIDYVMGQGKEEVGVEIHSGRNRIVRRMFEALGYQIEKLDRTALGPLTKKNLPRGNWRILSEKEVSYLQMM
ncbi:MAG: pseudouridine synthase [Bacteroidia bacterium]|nr:pseudouridine synthase [Bacteroidia bacterium]